MFGALCKCTMADNPLKISGASFVAITFEKGGFVWSKEFYVAKHHMINYCEQFSQSGYN